MQQQAESLRLNDGNTNAPYFQCIPDLPSATLSHVAGSSGYIIDLTCTQQQPNEPLVTFAMSDDHSSGDGADGQHRGRGGRGGGGRRGFGGRGRGRGRGGGGGGGFDNDSSHHHPLPPLSSLSPLQRTFAAHSASLDAHNDKRERVYQTARDLIKAAKRVIFVLQRPIAQPQHQHNTDTPSQATTPASPLPPLPAHLVQQVDEALAPVYECFVRLYDELSVDPANPQTPDPAVLADSYHRFCSSYSFGVQEFIEAVSFHHFVTTGTLITLPHVQQLVHNETDRPFLVLPSDYLLGLLDLPGEIMRFATNNSSLYPRLLDCCYDVMAGLDRMVSGLVLRPYGVYSGKLNVMRDSIQKLEKLNYRRAVREDVDEAVMAELVRGWGGGLERKRGLDDDDGPAGGPRGLDEAEGGKRMRVDEGDV